MAELDAVESARLNGTRARIVPFEQRIGKENVCDARSAAGLRVVLPRPSIDPGDFESVVPGAGVGPLALGPGADAVSVRLPLLPAAAVGAAVVEVEPAAVHVAPGGGRARGPGGRGGGGRAPVVPHLVRLLHARRSPHTGHPRHHTRDCRCAKAH